MITGLPTALEAFVHKKQEVDRFLNQLQQLSDEHFDVSPDQVNWSRVADISRYADVLKQLCCED
jgi:hypothetical protein